MKIGLFALIVALVAVPVYVVKHQHRQPATRQIAGPPGSTPPCPPFCVTKPITPK